MKRWFYSRKFHRPGAIGAVAALMASSLLGACGDDTFLYDGAYSSFNPDRVESGDLIIVSGGAVASTATPFPLHKIALFSAEGVFKRFLYEATGSAFLYGADLSPDSKNLYFVVENADRVESLDLSSFTSSNYVLDANLTGTTLRAMATLSDGSIVVAESTTSIEKFDANRNRITTVFPITVTASINSIRRISGDRFVVLTIESCINKYAHSAKKFIGA